MLNKRNLVLSLLGGSILASSSYASSPEIQTYVGAQLGYATSRSQVKSDYSNFNLGAGAGTRPGRIIEANLGVGGVLGGLHAGVAAVYCKTYYLGGELSAEFSNVQGSRSGFIVPLLNKDLTDSLRVEMTKSVDVAFKTGRYFSKTTLGYVKLGAAISNWKMRSTVAGTNIAKTSQYKVGFKPAVGVETSLTKNITVGGELSYTMYPPVKLEQKIETTQRTYTATHAVKPNLAAFQLRISYKL